MRTFIFIKDGVARILRTYALGPGGRVITPTDTDIPEVTPAPDAAEVMAKWHPGNASAVTGWREIAEADIPSNAVFKEAWRDAGSTISVDMPTARIIKTDEIRPERNERLAALDIDYMRADEAGDTAEKERVADVKQELRDLPATIQPDLEAIDQPEELEAYEPTWPTEPGD